MKKVLILALGVILAANVAFADHVGIYGDPAGTTCGLTLTGFGLKSVYVVHKFTAGATASRWKVVDSSGLFQAGNSSVYAVLGGPYTGASVGYGTCLSGSITAMTLNYFYQGETGFCKLMTITNDPIVASVIVTDCGFADKSATGGQFFFNPDGTCLNCNEVATETTTWGTIKALYR